MGDNQSKQRSKRRGTLILSVFLVMALIIPQGVAAANPEGAQGSAVSAGAAISVESDAAIQGKASLENTGGGRR
jgi:hypothetical protein